MNDTPQRQSVKTWLIAMLICLMLAVLPFASLYSLARHDVRTRIGPSKILHMTHLQFSLHHGLWFGFEAIDSHGNRDSYFWRLYPWRKLDFEQQ